MTIPQIDQIVDLVCISVSAVYLLTRRRDTVTFGAYLLNKALGYRYTKEPIVIKDPPYYDFTKIREIGVVEYIKSDVNDSQKISKIEIYQHPKTIKRRIWRMN